MRGTQAHEQSFDVRDVRLVRVVRIVLRSIGAEEEDGNLDEVTDAIDRRAAHEVVEEAMAVGRHREQIDAALFSEADQLGRGIAHRQLGGDFQTTCDVRSAASLREVIAVVFHLFRFAQLQLIEIARRPSIGDVHEVQLGADLHRELADVIEDRLVGGGVFDGNENAAVHRYASVCVQQPQR